MTFRAGSVAGSTRLLFSTGVTVGLAPTGSIADNGALTLGTALPLIYSQGLYLYFPADAIVTGSAAGFYWTVMSSTTAGVIYNNTFSTLVEPQAPTSNTAFVTTGPGAYTGVTSEITIYALPIPAGTLGVSGKIKGDILIDCTGSTNNKTTKISYGASSCYQVLATATVLTSLYNLLLTALGSTNKQTMYIATNSLGTSTSMVRPAEDTTAETTFSILITRVTATEYFNIDSVALMVQ